MSILIRGMKMPKGCAFCRIKRRNGTKMVCPLCDEKWDINDPMSADHRLADCPLVPVPSHGTLYSSTMFGHSTYYFYGYVYYDGTAGKSYYAVIVHYAGDSTGHDTEGSVTSTVIAT